jgi:uncharacterized protein YndB with AHSA1/START domain
MQLEKTVQIYASIQEVWTALTNPTAIRRWMGDEDVQVDLRLGGAFKLFGGTTTGQFTCIEPPEYLEYTWRRQDWPDSLVQWQLQTTGITTTVNLIHSQLPNPSEVDALDEFWGLDWLESMQE